MLFGIQAGQTVVLSRIARELDEDILLKKTEERLSRHLLGSGSPRQPFFAMGIVQSKFGLKQK